jgi:hypothetical protein
MDFESTISDPAEAKPNLSQLYLSRLSLVKPAKLNFFKTPASGLLVANRRKMKAATKIYSIKLSS